MALEAGTFVEDLVVTNPPGTDLKNQGDDHLRLIKTCLRNTFKRATRAFGFPGNVTKNANYTILSTDDGLTISCDTTSAFNLTLPALSASDAGWTIFVIKTTTDANPVFLVPSSGTINGFTKVRRSIEYLATRVFWTGNLWMATRTHGLPIGSSLNYHGSVLPNGHLWGDGAAFTAANFVELNAALGGAVVPDLRGRATIGRDNMGVGAAGRVTVGLSGITGTTLGATGGTETHTLTQAQLAAHNHGVNGGTGNSGIQSADHTHGPGTLATNTTGAHSHTINDHTHGAGSYAVVGTVGTTSGVGTNTGGVGQPVGGPSSNPGISGNSGLVSDRGTDSQGNHSHSVNSGATGGISANHTHTVTIDNMTGGGSAHQNMPPAIICNKIIVAE